MFTYLTTTSKLKCAIFEGVKKNTLNKIRSPGEDINMAAVSASIALHWV